MTPHFTSMFAAAFVGTLAASSLGCDPIDCGPGTLENNGSCVPADNMPDDAVCGAGTKLGPSGTCVPDQLTFCDPDTTIEQIDEATGVITCIGAGGGCATDLPCTAPTANNLSICGRLIDTETDQPIAAMNATGAACDPGNPSATGPCSLSVTFVDALQFAQNPQTATPHVPARFLLDDCGRYRAEDIGPSSFGFMGVAIDDATGTGDRYKLTGVALPDGDAKPARGFAAYGTRNETDAAWSAAISGQSFATRGVVAAVFRHGAVPVAGVAIRRDSQAIVADDYYFSNTAPSVRSTVDTALTVTGANGTALAVNPGSASVAAHDGAGAEPSGCRWPSSLAAAIPGVVFFQLKVAETAGGAECP